MNVSVNISLIPAVFLNVRSLTVFFFSSCWKAHANNNQFWLMPSSRSTGNVRSGRFKRLEQKTMPSPPKRARHHSCFPGVPQ